MRVPFDDNPLRQMMEYMGLSNNATVPVQRQASFGIGPTISGREVNPSPRPAPPPLVQRQGGGIACACSSAVSAAADLAMTVTIGQRIKSTLAAGETFQKCLSALDEIHAELGTLTDRRDAVRAEVSEREELLAELDDQIVKKGVELRQAQELFSGTSEKNNDARRGAGACRMLVTCLAAALRA